MNNSGIKDLIRALTCDEVIRARFVQDPSSVIKEFKLTEHEIKAVLSPRMRTALSGGNSTLIAEENSYEIWV
jgi:hypothetical protein